VLLAPGAAGAQTPIEACQSTRQLQIFRDTDEQGVSKTILVGSPGFPVVIECGAATITADRIEHANNMVQAIGNALIEQPDMRITAERAELSLLTQLGTFYGAHGFLRVGDQPMAGQPLGTQKTDMEFYAARIEKTGPRTYRLTDGRFTACAQAAPRWQFTMSGGTIVLDRHAVMRNAVLHVKNVPVFYVPLFYYPIDSDDRSTGFLMPSYGMSDVRGASFSNAFFWVLGRSHDLTLFHDWFTRSGQGAGAEYRYVAAPGSEGAARFYMLNERQQLTDDGLSVLRPKSRSYDVRGNVNQALPRGFRLVGHVNYFSDVTTQQLYQQDVFDMSRRTRAFNLSAVGNIGRARLTLTSEQRDWFYGADRGQRQGRLPQINVTVPDRPIGRSLVYFGVAGDASYLVRQDDINDPDTNYSLWRFDATPRVRVPVSKLSFLTATTTASWRVTQWLESLDATGERQPVALTRSLLDVRADIVGPSVARVFQTPNNGYAERFKHLIEPFVSFQWLSPFARRDEVVRIDGVDELVGGTMQATYGITNRLLARRRTGETTSVVRDILTVGVRQTYYTNLLAAAFDPQYQSATASPSSFSPLQLKVDFRPTDGLTAQFVTDIDAKFRTPRTYSASAIVNRERVQMQASWAKRRYIPGLPGFDDPARATHYLNAGGSVRTRDNRTGGGYFFNYDVLNGTLTQQRITAFYNAQCCGFTLEYQTIGGANYGAFRAPADRRFAFSFSLAGLASFANPLGSLGR
jgi:LPS-assembly protein